MASPTRYRLSRWWRNRVRDWGRDEEAKPPLLHGGFLVFPDGRVVTTTPGDIPLITAAANAAEGDTRASLGETGVTGLVVRQGRIYQEYSNRLQTLNTRMIAYEEMRRSDSAIAAMEAIISLPVRHADWRIEPGDDKELSARIEDNLFNGLSHSFDDLLREAVLAVLYGFTIHEKVFEQKDDGFLGWRKFAERSRTTVYQWKFDSTGGLDGIVQRGISPKEGVSVTKDIPIKKLIVWTWRKESGNPEGLGVLRQAYKPWMYKQYFEEFAAIRIERQACGIWVANGPPEGYTESERNDVIEILKNLRTAADASLVVPEGWTIEMLEPGPADVPFESHIERQHQAMLQTVLGQFVGLAQGGDSGAWALSRDSSSFFLMSLEAVADWFCSSFNRYAIDQLVRYNINEKVKNPRLVHGPMGVRDPFILANALNKLFDPKASIPEDVEMYAREELGLPELKEGQSVGKRNPIEEETE